MQAKQCEDVSRASLFQGAAVGGVCVSRSTLGRGFDWRLCKSFIPGGFVAFELT